MNNSSQLIETPLSVPGGATYEALAYIDAYDAVLNGDYAFVAYKETDSNGDWRVRVSSLNTAGSVFEPAQMKSNARSTGAQGKPWFAWGFGIDPSEGDCRHIQCRVHVQEGAPVAIEIFVQLRKFDGSADAPKSVTFPWPS
jgi:hypothetical protein